MDAGRRGKAGYLIAKILYRLGLLDATLSYTLECSECCQAFPINYEYIPTKSIGAEILRRYWKGPYCPACGAKKEAKLLRDVMEAALIVAPTRHDFILANLQPEYGESGKGRMDLEK